jgi:hypothetical protein
MCNMPMRPTLIYIIWSHTVCLLVCTLLATWPSPGDQSLSRDMGTMGSARVLIQDIRWCGRQGPWHRQIPTPEVPKHKQKQHGESRSDNWGWMTCGIIGLLNFYGKLLARVWTVGDRACESKTLLLYTYSNIYMFLSTMGAKLIV